MPDALPWIRSHILSLSAYKPILPFEVISERLERPTHEIIKLDANENPYGPAPAVREALADLPYTHIYPDPGSTALRRALADHTGLPIENILAGAGADELIDLIMRLFLEPGDGVVICPPTFGMYAFDAAVNRASILEVPRRPDFTLDIESLMDLVNKHRPKLLFLASPNNPDGSLIDDQDLAQILALPLVVVLDEAYIEFAPPGSSRLRDVRQYYNLVVLRTFSKWAALAGLRVGYGAFPESLIPHLWKIKQPYNVSVAASTAAITSLEHSDELQAIGRKIVSERERLFGMLQTVPYLEPYSSQANFILCRVVDREAGHLKEALAQRGILVRYFDSPRLRQYIRISVGKPSHSDALISALREME